MNISNSLNDNACILARLMMIQFNIILQYSIIIIIYHKSLLPGKRSIEMFTVYTLIYLSQEKIEQSMEKDGGLVQPTSQDYKIYSVALEAYYKHIGFCLGKIGKIQKYIIYRNIPISKNKVIIVVFFLQLPQPIFRQSLSKQIHAPC